MNMISRAAVATLVALALSQTALSQTALAQTALAQYQPTTIVSGDALLPTTGLVLDLPPEPGVEYKVSGSWAFDAAANSFDARDIVDEFSGGQLRAGNWILTGYFTAGGCDEILAGVALEDSWKQSATLWGETWSVRGGVYTFDGSLGRRPAAVLCRMDAKDRGLLLYRFLTSREPGLSQAQIISDVTSSRVQDRASRSFSAGRTGRAGDVAPMRRNNLRSRGADSAVRTIELEASGLKVDLPDDGYFWFHNAGNDVDFIDRLIPALPDISLELMALDNATCAEIVPQITTEQRQGHAPTGVPAGWTAGPTLLVDGETELTVCSPTDYGAIFVGVFQGPVERDLGPLHPMLQALARAKR